MLLCRWHLEVTNYAIRKQKLFRKRDKPLRMGFCRKAPPIEDVFGSYKLEKKKKKRRTNSASPLHHRPPKLWKKPLQPRSQGSLLPALRSERARERTWERGWSRGRCTFFPFITFDTRVNKTNFKAMKKKCHFLFYLYTALSGPKHQNTRVLVFLKQFIVNVKTRRLPCLWSLKHLLQITV